MPIIIVGYLFILAIAAGFSDASYCVCNSTLSDTVLQRNIDYACGSGADCSAIQQIGSCYNPNTVRDHCNYAVNSYYQRRSQSTDSCDFSATAFLSATPPATTSTGCVYQSAPSGTVGTPTIGTPPTGGTPTTGTPVFGGTPTVGTPVSGGTPTIGGTPTTGGATMVPPSSTGFGPGPTGSGFSNNANGAAQNRPFTLLLIWLGFIFSGI